MANLQWREHGQGASFRWVPFVEMVRNGQGEVGDAVWIQMGLKVIGKNTKCLQRILKSLDRQLFFLKNNFVLCLPNRPKGHNGLALQTPFLFSPTKDPSQPKIVTLTVAGSTHCTPKRENSNAQRVLALVQWRRMWYIDSSCLWQSCWSGNDFN